MRCCRSRIPRLHWCRSSIRGEVGRTLLSRIQRIRRGHRPSTSTPAATEGSKQQSLVVLLVFAGLPGCGRRVCHSYSLRQHRRRPQREQPGNDDDGDGARGPEGLFLRVGDPVIGSKEVSLATPIIEPRETYEVESQDRTDDLLFGDQQPGSRNRGKKPHKPLARRAICNTCSKRDSSSCSTEMVQKAAR